MAALGGQFTYTLDVRILIMTILLLSLHFNVRLLDFDIDFNSLDIDFACLEIDFHCSTFVV